jgi:predicted nucleic-acid-binding protein
MIGLDTNVLARYYVEDAQDREAVKQRTAARKLIESGKPLYIAKTVLLEFEWVLRGYYQYERAEIARALDHCVALPSATIEDEPVVTRAIAAYADGFDFADALHHASYVNCDSVATFDDKGFARKANRKNVLPRLLIPM